MGFLAIFYTARTKTFRFYHVHPVNSLCNCNMNDILAVTLIITDLKTNSLGRTEISEYTPPPMNAPITALCPFSFWQAE